MRRFVRRTLIGGAVTLVIACALIPAVVPPLAERAIVARLAECGVPAAAVLRLGYAWRNGPGIAGTLTVKALHGPWVVQVQAGASAGEWSIDAKMRETAFSEADPTLSNLLARISAGGVSNVTFSGSVALDAHAERTFRLPVPAWRVRLPIRRFAARAHLGETPYAIESLSAVAAASGLADHFDIAPLRVRAHAVEAGGFAFTNLAASVLVSEGSLLVSEASARIAGGTVGCYAFRLDPKQLNTGMTLFIDDIDARAALAHLKGFGGEVSGKLHGKARLFVREGGKALRIGETFLYSTPGETGKLRLADPAPITDQLALAGIDAATRANVAEALTDLDYSALKINFSRERNGDSTLSVGIHGSATRSGTTVPVSITVNLNGAIEQLVNTGLGYSAAMKGKKP